MATVQGPCAHAPQIHGRGLVGRGWHEMDGCHPSLDQAASACDIFAFARRSILHQSHKKWPAVNEPSVVSRISLFVLVNLVRFPHGGKVQVALSQLVRAFFSMLDDSRRQGLQQALVDTTRDGQAS